MQNFILQTHPEWHDILARSLSDMDADYLLELQQDEHWLPGKQRLFAAFQYPLSAIRYVLLGESPYPRAESANGYAFWDQNVTSLWSATGLSKEVNRATSLRNMIKMLLVARGDLSPYDVSQPAIAQLDTTIYYQTATGLFQSFLRHGFLLLNASLVYSEGEVPYHARMWRPFMHRLISILEAHSWLTWIILGRIAERIPMQCLSRVVMAEHPYNLSFITNKDVLNFFNPLDLLAYHDYDNER